MGGIASLQSGLTFWDGAFRGAIENAVEGFITGALLYCATQAIVGIVKAANRAINKARVLKFLNKNVPQEYHSRILRAFRSDIKVATLKDNTMVNRYWGGSSKELGRWVTPFKYDNPVSKLGLPSSNSATNVSKFIIPKCTTILENTVAANFGQIGGGYQYYLADLSIIIKI